MRTLQLLMTVLTCALLSAEASGAAASAMPTAAPTNITRRPGATGYRPTPPDSVGGQSVPAPSDRNTVGAARSRGAPITHGRGPQPRVPGNADALRKALNAPAQAGLIRQPGAHAPAAHLDAADARARAPAGAGQMPPRAIGGTTARQRGASIQSVASNAMSGSRRPPSGLVLGGATAPSRHVGNGTVDGSAFHRGH